MVVQLVKNDTLFLFQIQKRFCHKIAVDVQFAGSSFNKLVFGIINMPLAGKFHQSIQKPRFRPQ